MSTIADNLQTLIDCKADMKAAIESKGVTVSGGLSTYADAIREIEVGQIPYDTGIRLGFSEFVSAPYFDTKSFTDMNRMFMYCTELKSAPLYNTENVTDMSYMFYECQSLTDIPLYNTSKCANMSYMFDMCVNITSVPLFDTSRVTNMTNMFSGCSKLIQFPKFNTSNVTSMNGLIAGCTILTSMPLLDASNVVNINLADISAGYIMSNTSMVDFGGFKDYGKKQNIMDVDLRNFLIPFPNLRYASIMNVINNLYDRASAGYSILTLKLHSNHYRMLSDNDIAIATNKGWTITT